MRTFQNQYHVVCCELIFNTSSSSVLNKQPWCKSPPSSIRIYSFIKGLKFDQEKEIAIVSYFVETKPLSYETSCTLTQGYFMQPHVHILYSVSKHQSGEYSLGRVTQKCHKMLHACTEFSLIFLHKDQDSFFIALVRNQINLSVSHYSTGIRLLISDLRQFNFPCLKLMEIKLA